MQVCFWALLSTLALLAWCGSRFEGGTTWDKVRMLDGNLSNHSVEPLPDAEGAIWELDSYNGVVDTNMTSHLLKAYRQQMEQNRKRYQLLHPLGYSHKRRLLVYPTSGRAFRLLRLSKPPTTSVVSSRSRALAASDACAAVARAPHCARSHGHGKGSMLRTKAGNPGTAKVTGFHSEKVL